MSFTFTAVILAVVGKNGAGRGIGGSTQTLTEHSTYVVVVTLLSEMCSADKTGGGWH